MRRTPACVLLLLALAACGNKSDDKPGAGTGGGGKTATKEYTGFYFADKKDPPGGIAFAVTYPTAWKEEVDAMGTPSFQAPDTVLPTISLVIHACPNRAPEPEACLAHFVDQRFGDDLAATTQDKGAGRIWAVYHRPGDPKRDRERTIVSSIIGHPASKSVVECWGIVMDDASALMPAMKALCDSVAVR